MSQIDKSIETEWMPKAGVGGRGLEMGMIANGHKAFSDNMGPQIDYGDSCTILCCMLKPPKLCTLNGQI